MILFVCILTLSARFFIFAKYRSEILYIICFPYQDMFCRCFHFRVLENFVSSLFLLLAMAFKEC